MWVQYCSYIFDIATDTTASNPGGHSDDHSDDKDGAILAAWCARFSTTCGASGSS